MEEAPVQYIENCPECGGAIDVTDELPFAQIYCPHCGAGLRARRIFNNFELVELIGQGGMGSVFKAHDRTLDRMVALKVLKREVSAREHERAKLEQEARITASVNHPHVVRVYGFGEADGQFYLAMELVEKGSLDDLMTVAGRVSEAQVLEIGGQIAQGLEAAAERGLIHRDVKPGNILFADAHTTKIVDFGLARVLEEEAEARGEIWGTPYYIAPERLNYEPEDFRSDIYSLGGTLFHAIAGRPPFEAENAGLVALKQIKSQPVSLEAFAPDVAPETAYVINRMLEKNPDDRYGSYAELIEHLDFARSKVLERAGRPSSAKREVVQMENSRSKFYVALLSVAGALIVLASAAGLFILSDNPQVRSLRESVFAGTFLDPMVKAREALAAGRWDEAAGLLAGPADQSAIESPRDVSANLNLALALTLAGRVEEAKRPWSKLKNAGLFYPVESDKQFGLMARGVAEYALAGVPTPIPPETPAGHLGAQSLFLQGVIARSRGQQRIANDRFREFLEAPVDPADPWFACYRAIALLPAPSR
jgi:serine/threonine protein kinase